MEFVQQILRHATDAPNIAKAAGKRKTTSLASFQEMKAMGVEHVPVTDSVVAWAHSCWKNK